MRPVVIAALACLTLAGCSGGGATSSSSVSPGVPSSSAAPTGTAFTPVTAKPTLQATPTPAPAPAVKPAGFPIDPSTTLGVVLGENGARELRFDSGGPTAYDYALHDQTSPDPVLANQSGWNCQTHYEYEGAPADDFYIPLDTPIIATMDGTATLNVISPVNDFDRYGVSREPYIGNPDRSRAPYSPFPGPSGGTGVYVHIENSEFTTDYGHLDISATAGSIPPTAFLGGYSPSTDYYTVFAGAPQPRLVTPIAQWQVRRGDVIGKSGDAGYSEGPHLHYQLRRTGGPLRCPTGEPGFMDGGWLFK